MRYPAFIGGSNVSQSPIADPERTINWYVEFPETGGSLSSAQLYPTPGVTSIGSYAVGPGRAHFAENGREWAVIADQFVEISQSGVVTTLGTVAVDTNPATISSNGDGGGELFVTCGDNGYIYDITAGTFTQITALDGKATMGAQLDGYFLCLDASTSTVYLSDLLDGTTWTTGTQFIQRSIQSDPWVSMAVNDRYVWLLGERTSEIWYDKGTSPVPFAPHPAGLLPYGCAAAFSPFVIQGELCWIAANKDGTAVPVRSQGFSPVRIGTHAEILNLQSRTELAQAVAGGYEDEGHAFWMINIPNAGTTRTFDLATNRWSERGTWRSDESEYTAWRPRYHVFVFGEHRWLDSETGSIYRSSTSITTDVDGYGIRRLRRAPILHEQNHRIFVSSFELELESGLGTQTGQGANPQVMLRMSMDGKTWGKEFWRSAGKAGEYTKRVRWNRLGAGRKRGFEIAVSDPIPWRILDAYIEAPQLPKGLKRQIEGRNG